MKKETLKDWIKKYKLYQIVDIVFSRGMEFQVRPEQTDKDANDFKKIIVGELKRRLFTPPKGNNIKG